MVPDTGPTRLAYPVEEAVDVALRDGSCIGLRPVAAADRPGIQAFYEHLSSDSIIFRFFAAANLEWATNWSLDVDYADRYALVATAGADQEIVAHGAYIRIDAVRAEVAFVVADEWQGRGIATIMLAHLAAVADRHGISVFTAEVMPSNHRMIQVFRDSGFAVEVEAKDGVIEVRFPTSFSEDARRVFEAREQIAALAAVRSFLHPSSVAIIGASRRANTVGAAILNNVISRGFSGPIYPINPHARTISGLPAYASITDVPGPVELAVVVVPAAQVNAVARECGQAGVRALLVISAGFAEIGPAGVTRQRELLGICRDAGMRLIGPNCLGVLNTAPDVHLDVTFAAISPPPGNVGFFSQSGGLGIAMIEAAGRLGLGISSFVSVGDKADVSGNDLLEYWEADPATDVILLYLESFGNPRRFARIARRVSAHTPIVAVKSGRSAAGARATSSHTGALIAASDVTVDALFEQAGVIRVDTMHELFNVAALLSNQPVPAGARVAIVSNGGGPAILCADACQANGLKVVELSGEVRRQLGDFLPPEASTGNPIDMIATASAADYRRVIKVLTDLEACDAVITIFVPPIVTAGHDVAQEIEHAARAATGMTVAAVFMGRPDGEPSAGRRVPRFDFPEDAALALAHAAHYGRWRARPATPAAPPPDIRADEATAVIATALANGEGWLAPRDVATLLDCYGLPLIPTRIVANATQAVSAAAALGTPVALKAVADGLVHKSDAGGVVLSVSGTTAVRRAARQIRTAVTASGHDLSGLIVQSMAAPGVELIMGVVNDQSFGAVVACGAGGTNTELLKDIAVRITPLTPLDAREMLRSLRTFPLLDGYRGERPCDVPALEKMLLRLSALVDAHPEIAELDFNPVIARPETAQIVDARIRIHAAPPHRPPFALRG